MDESVWRTWKPYAFIVVGLIAATWWFNTQSSFAGLKDGDYSCVGVYVNESNKYERLVDDEGELYIGSATVRGGDLVALSGDTAMSASDVASLTVRSKGDSHFHATDDSSMSMYYAVACDHAGR
jgi:hypothetical protein